MSDIETRVKKIVAEQLGVAEADIKTESSFVDDLGADSLDTVELVMALEDEFEMEIPDEQAEKITTVQQAIDYAKALGWYDKTGSYSSHSDLVVAVRPGEIDVIGGNVRDSVTRKTLRTNGQGQLADPRPQAVSQQCPFRHAIRCGRWSGGQNQPHDTAGGPA